MVAIHTLAENCRAGASNTGGKERLRSEGFPAFARLRVDTTFLVILRRDQSACPIVTASAHGGHTVLHVGGQVPRHMEAEGFLL